MDTTAHKIFSSIFKEIAINAESFNQGKQDYSIDSSIMLNLILDKIYKLDPSGEAMEYVYNAVSDIREQDGNADKSYKALQDSLTFYLTTAIPFIYNGEYKEYDKASDYPETLRIDEYENEFVKQCTLFLIALKIVSQKDNPRIINLIKPNTKSITKPHPLELALLAAGKKVLNIIIKKLGTTNFESKTKEYLKGKFLS